MFSLIINYPDAHHISSNSHNPTTAIISGHAIKIYRRPLAEMINKIFDGKHDEFFGKTDLIAGEPGSILLTTKR